MNIGLNDSAYCTSTAPACSHWSSLNCTEASSLSCEVREKTQSYHQSSKLLVLFDIQVLPHCDALLQTYNPRLQAVTVGSGFIKVSLMPLRNCRTVSSFQHNFQLPQTQKIAEHIPSKSLRRGQLYLWMQSSIIFSLSDFLVQTSEKVLRRQSRAGVNSSHSLNLLVAHTILFFKAK